MRKIHDKVIKQLSYHRIDVAEVFGSYPSKIRSKMRDLRAIIIKAATTIEGVGQLEETLKWGEPSYSTILSKSGSTLRIDWKKTEPDNISIFFTCTTDLIPLIKQRLNNGKLQYKGNREILLKADTEFPVYELQLCIGLALTYHLNKKLSSKARWDFIIHQLR